MGNSTPLGNAALLMAGMALLSALEHALLVGDARRGRLHSAFSVAAALMALFGATVPFIYSATSSELWILSLKVQAFIVSLTWPLVVYAMELYSGWSCPRFRYGIAAVHLGLFTFNAFSAHSYVLASFEGLERKVFAGSEYSVPIATVGVAYAAYAATVLATVIFFGLAAQRLFRSGQVSEGRALSAGTALMAGILGLDMLTDLHVLELPPVGPFAILGFVVVMGHCTSRDLRAVRERYTNDLERINAELLGSRERLRRSQKLELFGQLAGGIAHDFNNLLTAVLVHTKLAEGAAESGELSRAQRHLKQIESAGQRAALLTRRLLASSRWQFVNARPLRPDEVVLGLRSTLAGVVGPNVGLSLDCAASRASIRIDSTQLEQVLVNLVVNASDAMSNGEGHVRVATCSEVVAGEPTRYLLSVEDTGQGMDEHTLSKLFEPYFTTKPVGKGTGLGTSTVHAIVMRAGGAIHVTSKPGRGTRFEIRFPCVADAEPAPVVASEDPRPPRDSAILPGRLATNARIAVCDDDPAVLDLTVHVLRAQGYRARGFGDPRELLAQVDRESAPDLLITDVAMPHMNGPELASELHGRAASVRVLFTSGYTAGVLDQHGFDEARAEFLPKPYGPTALLETVERLLGRQASGDAAEADWVRVGSQT